MTFRDWADEKGRTLANQDDECEVRAAWAKFYLKNPQAGSVLVYESAYEKFGTQQLDRLLSEQWSKADLQWVQITDRGVTETHKDAPNRPGKGLTTKH